MNKMKIEITPKEKTTLLKAIDIMIDEEQDTINHTKLIHKLRGE